METNTPRGIIEIVDGEGAILATSMSAEIAALWAWEFNQLTRRVFALGWRIAGSTLVRRFGWQQIEARGETFTLSAVEALRATAMLARRRLAAELQSEINTRFSETIASIRADQRQDVTEAFNLLTVQPWHDPRWTGVDVTELGAALRRAALDANPLLHPDRKLSFDEYVDTLREIHVVPNPPSAVFAVAN